MFKTSVIYFLLALGTLSGCQTINKEVAVNELRSEYLDNPLGLDTPSPRFTWNFASVKKEFAQKYYQIRVSTSPELLAQGKADV